jgi:hypothetical protein
MIMYFKTRAMARSFAEGKAHKASTTKSPKGRAVVLNRKGVL